MRTLYIDHSIVTHEPSWPDISQAIRSSQVRLVLSVWNLVEIGSATDEAQRERRLAFLNGLSPLWAVERLAIQRQEIERFLWQHKFGATPKELIAITSSLSIVDSFFAGAQTRIGLTARQFIRETDFAALLPLKRLSPDALRVLQAVDQKVLKDREQEMFEAWIVPSIPDRDPERRAFTIAQKAELAMFCWKRRRDFLTECRCLAVEDALSMARISNSRRQPTESDGLDLQHAAVALAYCDIFFSRDRYQVRCAELARDTLKTMELGAICATPEALAAAIAAL